MTIKQGFYVKQLYKLAEKDEYEKGCDGEGYNTLVDTSFEDARLASLLDKIASFIGADTSDAMSINPCSDDASRVEWQVYENQLGYPATKDEIERWKNGRTELWLVTYTAYVRYKSISFVDVQVTLDEQAREAAKVYKQQIDELRSFVTVFCGVRNVPIDQMDGKSFTSIGDYLGFAPLVTKYPSDVLGSVFTINTGGVAVTGQEA